MDVSLYISQLITLGSAMAAGAAIIGKTVFN